MEYKHKFGVLFALCAAALNATIGIFSKILIDNGFSTDSVAFIKTAVGCLLLSILLPLFKQPKNKSGRGQAAICSFLGIFVLFYFETAAYQHYVAAGVVVILMASAAISSILLGRFFLKDAITANVAVGAALTIIGIIVIFGFELRNGFSLQGAALASIAGCGYGSFSVAMKRMGVSGGLYFTRQLLSFGSIYLLIPISTIGIKIGDISLLTISAFMALALLPTVLGFFCTTKAIEYLRPSQVQMLELTEPIFSAAFAFALLNEVPGVSLYVGGALITTGLCFSNNIIEREGLLFKHNR